MSDSAPLFVPTRSTTANDVLALLWGRRPGGQRVGVAFTGLDLLRAACGPRQDWIRLHESALRDMLASHGITIIQFDPVLVGPDVGHPVGPVDTSAPAPTLDSVRWQVTVAADMVAWPSAPAATSGSQHAQLLSRPALVVIRRLLAVRPARSAFSQAR